jgi:hypothetical protein
LGFRGGVISGFPSSATPEAVGGSPRVW